MAETTVNIQGKTDTSKLKVGDYLSEIQYYKVTDITSDRIAVKNERGYEFTISAPILKEGAWSADQYNETVELPITKLVEQFLSIGDSVFSAGYHKKVKSKDIAAAIARINPGKIASNAEIKATLDSALEGEYREITGYVIKKEFGLGRSLVIDLEATNEEGKTQFRQIDHRTLQWFIYQNVKYILK